MFTSTTIIITVAVIVLGLTGYIIFNLLMKVEKLEAISNSREMYIELLNLQLKDTITKVNDLDKMGIYRSNEELGTFYDEIVEASSMLEDIIGGFSEQQS
jgi:septation ring formation regulator EzrA